MKKLARLIPSLCVWAILSIVFWEWIFTTFALDAPAAKKLCVAIDAPVTNATELAVQIEEILPDGFRMAKVYSFDYAMMDTSSITNADILIIPESAAESYAELISPEYEPLPLEGVAGEYIGYDSSESYYLYFGINSLHTGENDTAAFDAAEFILNIK